VTVISNSIFLLVRIGSRVCRLYAGLGTARPIGFRLAAGIGAAILILGLALTDAPPALAMRVGGTLVNSAGTPLISRDLHFQNCVTYDLYLSPTHQDGSFAAQLPPGCYQLRNETGAILIHRIYVGNYDVNIGRVTEGEKALFKDLFERQTIFPTLLTSPAPSTAYIFTRDYAAGLLPASAQKVPVPSSESEWLKLQTQTSSINTEITAPVPRTPLNSPNALGAIPPPSMGAGAYSSPMFGEPSLNPQQPVTAPPPGAMRANPYQ
jgi:hypothetical protein